VANYRDSADIAAIHSSNEPFPFQQIQDSRSTPRLR